MLHAHAAFSAINPGAAAEDEALDLLQEMSDSLATDIFKRKKKGRTVEKESDSTNEELKALEAYMLSNTKSSEL